MKQSCILIPALEPKKDLIGYIHQLLENEIGHIVVVNDGSNDTYDEIFNTIDKIERCTVLKHEQNRGKGAALKTGFSYIQSHLLDCEQVICADCDGQHSIEDIVALEQELYRKPEAIVLGSRNFSFRQAPWKSWIGNRCSSFFFMLLSGKWIPDTQTGLRGFQRKHLEFLQKIEGERFEYEMNMLMECIEKKMDLQFIPIETIYHNKNEGTHFRAIQDSYLIGKVLLKDFMKFLSSSVLCAILDVFLFYLVIQLLKNGEVSSSFLQVFVGTAVARSISMVCNYMINKKVIFRSDKTPFSFLGYLGLCVFILGSSSVLVYITSFILHIPEVFCKIFVDGALSFVSYYVQKNWIFKRK